MKIVESGIVAEIPRKRDKADAACARVRLAEKEAIIRRGKAELDAELEAHWTST